MEKEKEKDLIHPTTVEETEDLMRVLRAEGEIEFTLEGKPHKAWWARSSPDSRIYLHAYLDKRLRELEDLGLLEKTQKEIVCSPQEAITLSPPSIDEKTLEVKVQDRILRSNVDYAFNSDLGTIYFTEAPRSKIKVSYSFYNPTVYAELMRNCNMHVLVWSCLRKAENHSKKFFKSLEEVANLDQFDLTSILNQYLSKIRVSEERLKNLQGPQTSGAKDHMPNAGD